MSLRAAITGIALAATVYATDILDRFTPKHDKPAIESPIQESPLETTLNSETTKEPTSTQEQTLNIFKGYETRNQYDKIIIDEVNFWNNALKHIEGYQRLDPNLIKAQLMQETGNHKEYNTDPLQIAKDEGLKYLRGNDKRLEKLGFNQSQFQKDFTPELGIKGGIAFLVKNAIVWDNNANPAKLRSWEDALTKYNGGGTEKYGRDYVNEIEHKLGESWQ